MLRSMFGKQKQVIPKTGDLKEDFIQRLKSHGYDVEENVTVEGKSGIHCFDILARYKNSLIAYTMAIDIMIHDDGGEIGLGDTFAFDDKAYDCDIMDKVIIAIPRLSSPAMSFAQSQHIKVFDKESLESFLASPLWDGQDKKKILPRIARRSQLVEELTKAGYKVEEQARVKGKSSSEYNFDILACRDNGFITYRVAVEVLNGDEEANVERLSLFDTKAYDAGIDHKLLVTTTRLSSDFTCFAQKLGITIVETDDSAISYLGKILHHKPAGKKNKAN